MNWVIEAIVGVFLKAVAYIADVFGNSIVGLLTMDIGSGNSIFDIIFSSIGNFYQYFIVIAIAFLAINYVWQLSKMMFLAQGSNDTVLSLTGWTIIAGILIYCGRYIIYTFEGFFNIIYTALLSVNLEGEASTIDFSGISENMTTALTKSVPEQVVSGAGNVGGTILTLFLLFMLTYQFIMFLIEMVERYIVLGILYYTCPLAFSVLGSRSTSNIFSAWVRMVGSQMFLMLCNVIFFRIFMMGLNSYDSLMKMYNDQVAAKAGSLVNYNVATIIIVWVLIMHGILAVATRVDSYLNTLGLSAAQTGRGLSGAIVASAMGVRRSVSSIKNTGSNIVKGGKGAAALGKNAAGLAKKGHDKVTGRAVQKGADGLISPDSFGDAMNRNIRADNMDKLNGAKAGESFIEKSDLNGTSLAKGIDKSSFKANEDGTFSMKWKDPKTGEMAELTVASLDSDKQGATSVDPTMSRGHMITMADSQGNKMQMFAAASGAGANAFAAYNPAMEKKMKEFASKDNCSAQEVAPGVWHTTKTDTNGNILEAREYSNSQMYYPDVALNSSTEQIGDMSYNVSDITNALNSPAVADAGGSIVSNFPELQKMGDIQSSTDYGMGRFNVNINGTDYAVGAAALYDVAPNSTNVQTIHASNGAEYKLMPTGMDQQGGLLSRFDNSAPSSMVGPNGRNGRASGVFAREKAKIESVHTPVVRPKIYQAAYNKLSGNKSNKQNK